MLWTLLLVSFDGETTIMLMFVPSESAMGVKINAQEFPQSEYVKAVKDMCRIIVERSISATSRFWLLYCFTKDYKIEREAIRVLHGLSNSVIKARKEEFQNKAEEPKVDEFGAKKKCRPLLDILLLESKKEKEPLTDDELRQEVDTFMFAVILFKKCGYE